MVREGQVNLRTSDCCVYLRTVEIDKKHRRKILALFRGGVGHGIFALILAALLPEA